MSDSSLIRDALTESAVKRTHRRRFFGQAGVAGLGILGATQLANITALAQGAPTDADIFNFALNLEYLEAEFYLRGVLGRGLAATDITGTGTPGAVTGGRPVPFATEAVRQYFVEIAADEEAHVKFIRSVLGSAAVARPAINIQESFTAAARAAGLIGSDQTFDPYADENSFLLASFIFEDVGVTAYKGASPLITNKTFLEAAAGILAVEAYHAANIRNTLFERGLGAATNRISDARDALDGATDIDQGVLNTDRTANIVPSDANGIAFSRTFGQVLNVVYLTPTAATQGGFFPQGVNGTIRQSQANA